MTTDLRMMEEREPKLRALDLAMQRGTDDIEAGRVYDSDEVFHDLEAELQAYPFVRHPGKTG